ncbi:MAG: hypothetical protein WDO69_03075 [Pseudomonadota bacterium]
MSSKAILGLFGSLLLTACSSNYLTDGVVAITTGQEQDAWTVEPAAQNVLLELVQTTPSTRTPLAKVAAPVSSISIGTAGPQSTIASFEATAFDADANVVMKGATVPLGILGFEGAQVALFMGRVGGLSRAPGDLIFPRRHPQMQVLYHGYLLISGGDDEQANLDIYDMANWQVAPKQSPLPKVPYSWAVAGSKLLLIDREGATWLDMSTYVTSDVDAPVGLDFSDIVGGETIGSPGDPQYIVGATRVTDPPTDVVVRVDPDATLHLMNLGTPRLGAAAAIVNGQVLVVGGSKTGPGAEVSTADGTDFNPLPFPADARQGAALLAQDVTTAVLAGGRDPESDEIAGFRTMDLSCSEDCAPVEIAGADFAFDKPRLFSLDESQLLAVGEDPVTGETHVFSFDTGVGHAQSEFALRVPRAGASAFRLPNGQVGVLGGYTLPDQSASATSVELFFPQP